MRNKKEGEDSFSYVVGRRRAREGERPRIVNGWDGEMARGESARVRRGGGGNGNRRKREKERTGEEEIMRRQECTPTFTTCFSYVRVRWSPCEKRASVPCTRGMHRCAYFA